MKTKFKLLEISVQDALKAYRVIEDNPNLKVEWTSTNTILIKGKSMTEEVHSVLIENNIEFEQIS